MWQPALRYSQRLQPRFAFALQAELSLSHSCIFLLQTGNNDEQYLNNPDILLALPLTLLVALSMLNGSKLTSSPLQSFPRFPPSHNPTAYAWCSPANNGAITGPKCSRFIERGIERSVGQEGRKTTGQNPFAQSEGFPLRVAEHCLLIRSFLVLVIVVVWTDEVIKGR